MKPPNSDGHIVMVLITMAIILEMASWNAKTSPFGKGNSNEHDNHDGVVMIIIIIVFIIIIIVIIIIIIIIPEGLKPPTSIHIYIYNPPDNPPDKPSLTIVKPSFSHRIIFKDSHLQ